MVISSRPVDPLQGYQFRVTIEGLSVGGFKEVSGLRGEVGVAEYREGTDTAVARKQPGIATFDDLVLVRGITPNGALIAWWNQVVNLQGGRQDLSEVVVPPEIRRVVNIQLVNHAGVPLREWDVLEAWPNSFENDPFDATSNDVVMERMTLANEGFEPRIPRGVASLFSDTVASSALFSFGLP